MVRDRLTEKVLRRFKELGLPPSLVDLDGFREGFLFQQWVMFVRDGDDVANVHLIQPQQSIQSLLRECGNSRHRRTNR